MPIAAASLANLRPFRRGKSGFAGQQPRGYRVTLTAARKASPEAMQTIIECMSDPEAPWPARIKACELVLERAWGKPDPRLLHDENGASSLTIRFVDPDGTERSYDEGSRAKGDVAKVADEQPINDRRSVTPPHIPPLHMVRDAEEETTVLPSQVRQPDELIVPQNNGKVPSLRARNAAGIFR